MEKEITANFTMEEPQRLEVTFEMTEGGKGTKDHSQLENRDLPDQHPISAITDLENTLAGKQANLSQAQIDATNSGITSSKVSIYDQYATSKQDKLSQAQQNAVDSGITSQKVETYDGYATSKQDKLSQNQQSAVDSGITSTKVGEYDSHIANKSNPHEVTKSQVGLGNADNTSDLDKPISTATQTALDGKVPVTRKVNDKALSADITLNATDVSALPNSTKYGASLSLTINSSTYVMTAQLKDQDGNDLGSAQTIDLPLESVVVSGSYDSQNKKVILTLQNGSTIEFSVADLVSGLQTEITSNNKLSADLVDDTSTTNKFVTTTEKDTWNAKQNALATQTAYTNKGSATKVPRITTNNLGQVTNITEVTITQPTVNNNTITITQGGTTKGSFTLNQNSDTTIALDAGGGSELPSQTGQAGKFLTTDGEQLSWAEVQGGGGSGEPITILNVSQTGNMDINGTKVSGFDRDNYIQPAQYQKGYFVPNVPLDFGKYVDGAWEIGIVFNSSDLSAENDIVSQWYYNDTTRHLQVYVYNNKILIQVLFDNAEGTTTIQENTDYYIRVVYTGSEYQLYLSTTSFEDATLEATLQEANALDSKEIFFGIYKDKVSQDPPTLLVGYIDLAKCYIKSEGNIVWEGTTQINGASVVNNIPLLNVVQTGAVEREGTVVYGFSPNDYLQIGDLLNGNSFQANTVKEFAHITPTANSWEVVFKINYVAGNSEQSLFSEGIGTLPSHSGDLCIDNGKMFMNVGDENGDYVSFAGTTTLVDGTTYWLKYAFTGTAYKMELSTDGVTFTQEGSQNSSSKITRQQPWKIGILNENLGGTVISEIDLEGCWIKADGEYVWKGVLPFISNGGSTVYTETIFEGNIGSTLDVSPLSLSNAVAIERNGQKIYKSSDGETRDYTISGSVITFTIPLIATDRIGVISSNIAPIDLTPYALKSDFKVLNVVETGDLTVDGSVYSDFSLSNYLELGSKMNKGYLRLTDKPLDFVGIVSQADSWEMVWKIHYIEKTGTGGQCLFSEGEPNNPPANFCYFVYDGKFYLRFTNNNGIFINEEEGVTSLVDDTDYWIKLVFTGSAYVVSISTDGENFTTDISVNSSEKITRDNIWKIGCMSNGQPNDNLNSLLDLLGCYLKADGEIVWKGIETL